MKKTIRKILLLSIIIVIIVLYSYREAININNYAKDGNMPKETIQISIIDKYNNMDKLHERARAEEYVLVDIIIDGNYYYNVGIRTKGSAIYQYLKKNNSDRYSYKVKLDYKDTEQRYLGMNEILLNNQVMDETGIREYMVYEVYNKMGIKTQRYGLGNLKIDNKEIGLVTIVENINEQYIEHKYGSSNGNLYKPERMDPQHENGAELNYISDRIGDYQGLFNNIQTENTNDEDKNRLINILKKIEEAKTTKEIEENFIDLDKVIKSVAINKAVANLDNFTGKTIRNFYVYEENGKIDIIPFDFNISLGMCPEGYNWTQEDVEDLELTEHQENIHSQLVDIIIQNEEYTPKYNQYVHEALQILKKIDIDKIIPKQNVKGIEELKNFIKTRTKEGTG